MVDKNYISGLFGRSPITPLQEHMYRTYKGIKFLIPLIKGMIEVDEEKTHCQQVQYSQLCSSIY